MNILMKECPYRGFPTEFGRNPSIRHGAIQGHLADKIKTDIYDDTIGISPLVLTASGADFDGDAMNGRVHKEMGMVPTMMKMHPMTTLLGAERQEITSTVSLEKEITMGAHIWNNDPAQFIGATDEIIDII